MFNGTTIDSKKWKVTNPDPTSVLFSQNNSLIMDTYFTSKTLFNNEIISHYCINEGVVRFTLCDLDENSGAIREWGLRSLNKKNRIKIYRATGNGKLFFQILSGDSVVYDLDTTIQDFAILKVVITATEISLYKWLEHWVQVGETQTASLGNLYFYMTSPGTGGAKTIISDLYITDNDYTTITP